MKAKTIAHVSVLIDTYNHERFIEQAITSVPGHIGVIQPNAIERSKRVHPQAEVILFRDEPGVADG